MNPTQEEIEERARAFFAQNVETGPLVPGEYQQPESSNPLTAVIEPTMQDQEEFQKMMNQEPTTPTTTDISPTKRTLTLTYSRTVQVTQYEPATVSATMEAVLPDNCTLEEAMGVYENEMQLVKAAVLSQQGLPFELSPNERIIQEVFGETQLVGQAPAPAQLPPPTQMPPPAAGQFQAPPPAAAPAAAGPPTRTKTPSPADDPWWDMLVANPAGWWDNRPTKTNPNAPDFKLKVDRDATPEEKKDAKALWLNACPDRHCAHFGVQL